MTNVVLDRLAFVSVVLFGFSAWSRAADAPVRIAHFSGDRAAAISYTFDDGMRDQLKVAVPMLDAVGFKGTFFVIAGKTPDTPEEGEQKKENGNVRNLWGGISWPELKALSARGHEIASHTWEHVGLTKLSPAELDEQLGKAYDAIKAHLGQPPLTLAFPGNGSNAAVQAAALKYHVAYRAYQEATTDKSTVASLNAWADRLVQDRKWGILMTHGITEGYAVMQSPEILRGHFKYVKSRAADIWVDTFANVARYEKERDDAQLAVSATPAGAVTCTLTGTLDAQRYDVPLTLVVSARNVASARATRAGQDLAVRVEKDTIYVQAVPDVRPISITWQ